MAYKTLTSLLSVGSAMAVALNKVYCVADSFTYLPNSYADKLQTLLGTGAWLVVKRGIGGRTSTDALAAFPSEVAQYKDARDVVVLLGVNDINLGRAAAQIKADLAGLYTAAENLGAVLVAVIIAPCNSYTAA